MSELTLLLLRFGFLFVLWAFVFAVVYALRSDLFGQRARRLPPEPVAAPYVRSAVAPSPFVPTPATPAPAAPPVPVAPTPVTASTAAPFPFFAPAPAGPAATEAFTVVPHSASATRIVITSGPKEGLEFELPKEPLTIGRSSESGLVIRDDYTSTHHARLMLWSDDWVIQDLDSTNGTFLNGSRVTLPTPVPLNTPVRIGTTSFELRR
jgi:hypothetical protein